MAGTRRKTPGGVKTSNTKRAKTIDLGWKGDGDDEIDSDEEDHHHQHGRDDSSSESEEEETLEAKKVRLAKEYLQKLEQAGGDTSSSEEDEDEDDEEVDRVGLKLQKQRLKREGVYERDLADKLAKRIESIKLDIVDKRRQQQTKKQKDLAPKTLKASQLAKEWIDHDYVTLLKGHDLTTTCVSLQADGSRAVSGSKDHSVILWDIENSKRIVNLWDHWKKRGDHGTRTEGQVLSIACSHDGRYAAVGRRNATVSIFDIRQGKSDPVKVFSGHKSVITCLSFQTQSLQLFSGSEDRCIRHYNLEEMMYLETLYGHQFGVTGMDCHRKERPISVGRDRTARAWKLQEDTHLIFRGGAKLSPADCVTVLKDDWFLTGHENGQLCLWMTDKKKAVATVDYAHGTSDVANVTAATQENTAALGNSVGSIGSVKGSDVVCTGSNDGFLRFWKVSTGSTIAERGLEPLSHIPVHGYVNDIDMGPKSKFCLVALGQEPRLGRWNCISKAKNRIGVVRLHSESLADDVGSDRDETAPIAEDDNEPPGVDSGSEDSEE